MVDAHADYLVAQCGNGCLDGLSHFQSAEAVFAHVEGHVHILHFGNVHDGRSCAHEFTLLRENLAHLACTGGDEHGFAEVRIDFAHGAAGFFHQCHGCCSVFAVGTIDGHIILCLGRLLGGDGGIALSGNLVQFLCCHHAFIVQALDAFVGFLGDFESRFCFLPHLVGSANLLLACAALGLAVLRHSSRLCGLGLCQFGVNIGCFEQCQRVASVHLVALFHVEAVDASRHFARYAILFGFGLSLNVVLVVGEGKCAAYGDEDSHGGKDGQRGQEVQIVFGFHGD